MMDTFETLRFRFDYLWAAVVSLGAALVISVGCTEQGDSSWSLPLLGASEGKQLMQTHCGTCHVPVPASALDRETWVNSVLPRMAPKVGIDRIWGRYYPGGNASGGTSISMEAWRKIVGYYEEEAPDSLHVPGPPSSMQTDLPSFTVREPQWTSQDRAATVMVAYDSTDQRIYFSDVVAGETYWTGERLESPAVVPSIPFGVDVRFIRDSTGSRHGVFTSIGTMRAVDVANGEVWDVNLDTDSSRVIATGLPRPVRSLPGDFNQDGLRDWIVCGFGHTKGALYLFEQQPDHTFEKRVIRGVPGAVDARVDDFNDDGYPDVMVLFAHGNEGIWLFTNDQQGGFDSRSLLRFPPVYGSTHFQLVDFNGDGKRDILYTSGDNADFSQILKPYHGIYIFLNQGDFEYEQAYFYHFNGTTEALAADFDDDGDLDIGAIAFFADLKDKSATDFVYLEQTGPLEFTPHAPPVQQYGNWLSMDVGDYDGDADKDLILGNYAAQGYLSPDRTGEGTSPGFPFIVLENQLR